MMVFAIELDPDAASCGSGRHDNAFRDERRAPPVTSTCPFGKTLPLDPVNLVLLKSN
jgi:hypothetical protein